MDLKAKLRRAALASALAVPLVAVHGRAQAPAADSELRAALARRVLTGKNPAIVVGIYENGQTRVIPMGRADAPNDSLDGNTVFEIGSITKVFTGTLLADMVARGLVSLDDPVSKFLPSAVKVPSRNGRAITLLDLAEQHSGLPRLPNNLHPGDPGNPYADYSVEQMYAFLSGYELPRDPGATFEYSNLGVGLLGHVLGLRAGMSWEALAVDRILGPLGMTRTRVVFTDDMQRRLAKGHGLDGSSPAKNWDLPTLAGAGALRSTANDMLRFAAAALGAPGTPPALATAVAEAERPRRDVAANGTMKIGLNWFTSRTGPVEIVWHNGGTGGYRSYLGLDKAHQRAVVVLTNSGAGVDDIGRHVLDPSIPFVTAP